MHRILFALLLLTAPVAAQTYRPPFDPSAHKGPRSGPANEVAVLGSVHLSQLPKRFQPEALGPLLDKLAAWKPQAIAIEDVSGAQCAELRRYPDRYADTVASYCPDTAPARAATGMDVPTATAAFQKMLADWPAAPSPAQRRRLSATFLAAGEQASALVQWLRLPSAERRTGDGLDTPLVERLTKLETRRDESLMIAARLAARLGLERVHAMDDHSADRMTPKADEAAYGAAIQKAWDNPAGAKRRVMGEAAERNLSTGPGLLTLYRAHNAPGIVRMIYDSDFGAALEEPSPQRFGRQYVAYWEVRNLRMAANIRDMLGDRPGQRALVVVGASHKPYLDAYLHQMHDVRVVDVMPLLR
ncbi:MULTISPECIES: DUF5694 domain-containing protein [unclassified Sphingomonas]|uniref:DUF5694 domain-containing protein n=1 Tax=unclassified Sphingomonas TaxID=196159 RepID=UPI0006FE7446|nr:MULTISPECIES: DUF5694 domain-containing protein [unclassified Sphingomonas]KQM61922.1 hypothetical protein ASE65_06935 [Sphingomonas sp. Leaf16]KQN13195.1 hypothetical protein ASE81_07950 [Sphingomonas sp. Leaf29]KQN20080.1 hypothetical protein ASE83_07875 [Sphingomonas sp. Leaf32]